MSDKQVTSEYSDYAQMQDVSGPKQKSDSETIASLTGGVNDQRSALFICKYSRILNNIDECNNNNAVPGLLPK